MRPSDVDPLPGPFRVGPAERGHEVGVRVAVTALVPMLLVFFLGRMDLALYVTFGSMAGIYGRGQRHGPRVRSQLRAGVLMLVVLAAATVAGQAGISETADPWGLVWTTSLVSGFCALVCGYWNLRPTGSLFHIFAFAAVASVPFKPAPLEGMLTALAVVLWALLVGIGSRVHPGRRHPFEWPAPDRPDAARLRVIGEETLWHAFSAALAGSLATLLRYPTGLGHNYWAMMAAVVPLAGHTTRHSVNRGLQRVIGTFAGLVVTAAVILVDPPALAVVVLVVLLQGFVETFVVRQYALAMLGVTPMALLSLMVVTATAGGAGSLAAAGGMTTLVDRAVETVLGAVVGVACVLAPWVWRTLVRRSQDASVSR